MSIEAFLQGGGSVCPFAAGSRRHYATVGEPLRLYRPVIRGAAEVFARTKGKNPPGALLVVGMRDPDGFEATRTWAREVFLELMACFGLMAGATEAELVTPIAAARAILFDDADTIRPVLACDGAPLFAICMSPVYPTTHPRYAPRATVVVTWHADVEATYALPSSTQAIRVIRERMRRSQGVVYDADELMLPLPEGPR